MENWKYGIVLTSVTMNIQKRAGNIFITHPHLESLLQFLQKEDKTLKQFYYAKNRLENKHFLAMGYTENKDLPYWFEYLGEREYDFFIHNKKLKNLTTKSKSDVLKAVLAYKKNRLIVFIDPNSLLRQAKALNEFLSNENNIEKFLKSGFIEKN